MVAIGVNDDGYREVIGAAEGFTESAECWREFLSWLKSRGLRGVRMFTGDKAAGMVGSIAEVFPNAAYQRCTVHFYRNALAKVPKSKRPKAAAMLKAIHAMESARGLRGQGPRGGRRARLNEAEGGREGRPRRIRRDPDVHALPARALAAHTHQQRHRAPEPRDPQAHARGRTFPDGKSALMLVTARLKYVAESEWGSRRYLDVTLLEG